jgi:hypothetical protein
MSEIVDKRAAKILHDTFWSPEGWKRESERVLSAEDFSYAKAKGLMFDPVNADHTQAVSAVTKLVDRLNRRMVADAFLSSLSTRRLDWRSAMGSYFVSQHLLPHEPQRASGRRRTSACASHQASFSTMACRASLLISSAQALISSSLNPGLTSVHIDSATRSKACLSVRVESTPIENFGDPRH